MKNFICLSVLAVIAMIGFTVNAANGENESNKTTTIKVTTTTSDNVSDSLLAVLKENGVLKPGKGFTVTKTIYNNDGTTTVTRNQWKDGGDVLTTTVTDSKGSTTTTQPLKDNAAALQLQQDVDKALEQIQLAGTQTEKAADQAEKVAK